jgi:glycosyltransferase involved in cell wall biosynthesis
MPNKIQSIFPKFFIIILINLSFFLSASANEKSVHVLMPMYNTEKYIESSIGSVASQTKSANINLIIYDDGSSDSSYDVANKILSNQKNIKFHIQRAKKNLGISNARKELIRISKEINPEAYILWLDSDDKYTDNEFIAKFYSLMNSTGADICLFNYDVKFENESDRANATGLFQEKEASEKVLDQVSARGAVSPSEISGILTFTSLGWTKGYSSKVKFAEPANAPYEDFVYMANLLTAKKITAMPSSYKPVQFLRRSSSTTGKRTAQSFFDVLSQLTKFKDSIPSDLKVIYKNEANSFVERKVLQYRQILKNIVDSSGRPDIDETILSKYDEESKKLLNR